MTDLGSLEDVLWVVQPDTEGELARLARGVPSYEPNSAAIRAATERASFFEPLFSGLSWVFAHHLSRDSRFARRRALFWCPTPYSLEMARRARLVLGTSPELAVLLNVHHKAFPQAAGLPVMRERRTLQSEEALHQMLATSSKVRLRRPYGSAGRGQRVVTAPLRADDQRFVKESLIQEHERKQGRYSQCFPSGALIAEPELESPDLWSVHGVVSKNALLLGNPVPNPSDAYSAPLVPKTSEAPETAVGPQAEEVEELVKKTAESLSRAGYFGPFGIDLITQKGRPPVLIDLNPRLTLHFARGLGEKWPEALRLLAQDSFVS